MELSNRMLNENTPVKIGAQIYTDNKANWWQLFDEFTLYGNGRNT